LEHDRDGVRPVVLEHSSQCIRPVIQLFRGFQDPSARGLADACLTGATIEHIAHGDFANSRRLRNVFKRIASGQLLNAFITSLSQKKSSKFG
jgi:hypothetical protein